MEWYRGGTTGPSQRQEPLPGRHQGLSRLTGFFPLPKRLAGRISRVPLSGLMLPELPKDKSQEREVQMGLFARLDLGEARLPRPREEADAARNGRPKDERLARPAPRRSASSQPLLPFDRPKPPARAPTGDAEPRAEIPKAQAPRVATPAEPSPPGLPALPPESVATGEVAKARDLLHAIRVLKQVETERRLPDAEERKALTLRQEAQERRKRLETRKPFIGTLRVNESRPATLGQQPEASLAWGGVILTAKRRQRVPRPCD